MESLPQEIRCIIDNYNRTILNARISIIRNYEQSRNELLIKYTVRRLGNIKCNKIKDCDWAWYNATSEYLDYWIFDSRICMLLHNSYSDSDIDTLIDAVVLNFRTITELSGSDRIKTLAPLIKFIKTNGMQKEAKSDIKLVVIKKDE